MVIKESTENLFIVHLPPFSRLFVFPSSSSILQAVHLPQLYLSCTQILFHSSTLLLLVEFERLVLLTIGIRGFDSQLQVANAMTLNVKLILDEFNRRFDAVEARLDWRFAKLL